MPSHKPNILIISTHDSGCHFGCYGIPTVHTPAIDGLAAEGVRFTNMFATSSICSPSRGSLLTGRYPQRNGLIGLAGSGWDCELNDPQQHLSHILRGAGYQTRLFGVQHETADLDTLGFDECRPNAIGRALPQEEHLPPDPYEIPLHVSAIQSAPQTAQDVAAFFDGHEQDGQSFYAQVGFFETHTPFLWDGCDPDDEKGIHVPDYARLEDEEEARKQEQHIAGLQGSLRRVDEAVATILNALRRNNLEENTLVLFVTDHGPELPGAKWTMTDAGLRIAFILRWPGGGVGGGQVCDALRSNVDFLPTLAELVDLQLPFDCDGTSFAAGLRSGAIADKEAVFGLNLYGQNYAVRTPRHKLVHNFAERVFSRNLPRTGSEQAPIELFDLQADPLERENLVEDSSRGDVVRGLEERFWGWLEGAGDPMLSESPPGEAALAMQEAFRAWKQRETIT